MEVYKLTKQEAENFDFDVNFSPTEWRLEGDTHYLFYSIEDVMFRLEKAGKKPCYFYVQCYTELHNIIKIIQLMDD